MEPKLKHLEFIQKSSTASPPPPFRMKGWTVVLTAALLVLLAREGHIEFSPIGLIPVFFFWGSTATFCGRSACSERSTITSGYWRKPQSTSQWMSARSGQTARGLGWARHSREH